MHTAKAILIAFVLISTTAHADTPEERKAKAEAELAAVKAEIALEAARLSAYKDVFGAAPAVGMDGTVTISDTATGQLLRNKAGSLIVTKELAFQICAELERAGISDTFIAPADLDAKVQSGQLMASELDYLYTQVAQAPVLASVASALSGLAIAKYGLNGIADLLKIFRSNYEIGLSSTDRSSWLAYFMSARCQKVLPVANTESVLRSQSVADAITKLNKIAKFSDDFDRATSDATDAIALEEKKIADELKKDEKNQDKATIKLSQDEIVSRRKAIKDMGVHKNLVARIKALNTFVSSKPGEFLDAQMWSKYAAPPFATKSRLVVALTTQDAQLAKTNFFLGKRIYGQSAGEAIYRVVSTDGSTAIVGYVTATETLGKADFESGDPMRCETIEGRKNPRPNCSPR